MSDESAPAMPSRWKSSVQVKLVAAFLLVSVVPMMFAAEVATRVVSGAFERNVETWLHDTSVYFLANIRDVQEEATGIARFIADEQDIGSQLRNGALMLPPSVTRLAKALEYDLLAIYDQDKHILYSSQPVLAVEQVPLASDNSLFRVQLPDRTAVMAAGVRRLDIDGKPYFLLLGSWLDDDFFVGLKSITSIDLRLYFRVGNEFSEFYSSQPHMADTNPLSPDVTETLLQTRNAVYDPEADNGRYRGMFTPFLNTEGEVVGAIFSGLKSSETLSGWLTQTNLFLSIFLVGTLLSVLAAIMVSRRITRPLRSLATGVGGITAGDYAQRVGVQGSDEVADLAAALNVMAERLGQLHDLEAQLRRRERLSALGEVAVGIAHEVRNPLGIIKSSAELVQKKTALAPAEARLLQYVVDEVRRIDLLIKDFLAFAKPAEPDLKPLLAMAVIDRVGRFAEPELNRKGIKLELLDLAPNATIIGDEDQLFQASLNLILNAIDAMPDGGTLEIVLFRTGDELQIDFSDTGAGISAELQERIFNPFFTTKENGTGLGLAKVFAVMESHGGGVTCHSQPGQGATFTLTLPIAKVLNAA